MTKKGQEMPIETRLKISLKHTGKMLTEEHKRKIGLSNSGKKCPWLTERNLKNNPIFKYHLGHKHSVETRNKISLSKIGQKHSAKSKEKIRVSLIGNTRGFKKGQSSLNKGKKMSEEQKIKLSKSLLGRKISEESIIKMKNTWNKPEYKEFAKQRRTKQILPKKDTSIEVKIQNFLKELNIDFFTHQYINIEHGYQCDILIPNMNLVIECDGMYWHKYPIGREIDHIRTSELIEKGFKVLRLWEFEINNLSLDNFNKLINKKISDGQ